MRRKRRVSDKLRRLASLRMKQWWYEEKNGLPHHYKKDVPPKPLVPPPPTRYEPDFWDRLNSKKREYEKRGDKWMLTVLGDIRYFATRDLSNGSVPLWIQNWLKYVDVAPIHWSETAECEEGNPLPEDEYNGVEEDEPWWNGGIEMPSERLRRKPVVRL